MGVIAKNFGIAAATVALIGAFTVASAQTGGGSGPTNPPGQGAITGNNVGTSPTGNAGTTGATGSMGAGSTTSGTGAAATGGSMSNQTGMAAGGESRNRGKRAARRARG